MSFQYFEPQGPLASWLQPGGVLVVVRHPECDEGLGDPMNQSDGGGTRDHSPSAQVRWDRVPQSPGTVRMVRMFVGFWILAWPGPGAAAASSLAGWCLGWGLGVRELGASRCGAHIYQLRVFMPVAG